MRALATGKGSSRATPPLCSRESVERGGGLGGGPPATDADAITWGEGRGARGERAGEGVSEGEVDHG